MEDEFFKKKLGHALDYFESSGIRELVSDIVKANKPKDKDILTLNYYYIAFKMTQIYIDFYSLFDHSASQYYYKMPHRDDWDITENQYAKLESIFDGYSDFKKTLFDNMKKDRVVDKELLLRYLKDYVHHVATCEGTDFIPSIMECEPQDMYLLHIEELIKN